MSGYVRKTFPVIYICGGNYSLLQKREACPNPVHDWPLPSGYAEASDVAAARLRARWSNKKCLDCGLYGWLPSGKRPETTNPIIVTAADAAEKPRKTT